MNKAILKERLTRAPEQTEDKWYGYKAENLMNGFYKASENKYTLSEWRELLESILFTLAPYYDSICNEQRINITNQDIMLTPMLTVREIITYKNILYNLTEGDIWGTIHELMEFIKDYGAYKDKFLSKIETVMIYSLCQQVVLLIRKVENKTGK